MLLSSGKPYFHHSHFTIILTYLLAFGSCAFYLLVLAFSASQHFFHFTPGIISLLLNFHRSSDKRQWPCARRLQIKKKKLPGGSHHCVRRDAMAKQRQTESAKVNKGAAVWQSLTALTTQNQTDPKGIVLGFVASVWKYILYFDCVLLLQPNSYYIFLFLTGSNLIVNVLLVSKIKFIISIFLANKMKYNKFHVLKEFALSECLRGEKKINGSNYLQFVYVFQLLGGWTKGVREAVELSERKGCTDRVHLHLCTCVIILHVSPRTGSGSERLWDTFSADLSATHYSNPMILASV